MSLGSVVLGLMLSLDLVKECSIAWLIASVIAVSQVLIGDLILEAASIDL